jgi:hypothetical protein
LYGVQPREFAEILAFAFHFFDGFLLVGSIDIDTIQCELMSIKGTQRMLCLLLDGLLQFGD